MKMQEASLTLGLQTESTRSSLSIFQMNSEVTPAGGTYIPHDRFFMITCSLILGAVVCGVLFPNGTI